MRLTDCQEVADAADVQTFETRLIRLANSRGFGIISGFVVVERSDIPASMYTFGNTPEAFDAQFRNPPAAKRCPVLRRLKQLSVPFVYDQTLYVSEHAGDIWEAQARSEEHTSELQSPC